MATTGITVADSTVENYFDNIINVGNCGDRMLNNTFYHLYLVMK